MFQPIIAAAVRGDPDAVLIVEFAEEDQVENLGRLKQLGELMADLGFGWDHAQAQVGWCSRDNRARDADRHRRISRRRPQCHDVDEAGGQAGLVRRGLRRASADILPTTPNGSTASLPGTAPAAPCMRTPPKAVCMSAGAEPETRKGRQGDARHRRGNLRDGARIQGIAFRRARRRHWCDRNFTR